MRSATGLLTRGSLPRRLPDLRQWLRGGGASPLTAAGPSRIRTGFPHRAPWLEAEPIIGRCPVRGVCPGRLPSSPAREKQARQGRRERQYEVILARLRTKPRAALQPPATRRAFLGRPPARLWLPVLAWAGVIFAFSSVPDLGTGLGGWDLALRKLAHAAEYGVLGALLARATGRGGLALALGTLYAVSDEIHQTFVPGRMGSPLDVAIDAIGVACGIAVWQTVRSRRLA